MTPEQNIELAAEMLKDILSQVELEEWKRGALADLRAAPDAADSMAQVGMPAIETCEALGGAEDAIRKVAGLPSRASEAGKRIVNERHGPTQEIKRRALSRYDELRHANPKVSKNNAAKKIAPELIKWGKELDCNIAACRSETEAEKQVREWLKPSKMK